MNEEKKDVKTLTEDLLLKSLTDLDNVTEPAERSKRLDDCGKLADILINMETLEDTKLKNYSEREKLDADTRKSENESAKCYVEAKNGTIKTYVEAVGFTVTSVGTILLSAWAIRKGYKFEYEDAGIPMGKTFGNIVKDIVSRGKIGK